MVKLEYSFDNGQREVYKTEECYDAEAARELLKMRQKEFGGMKLFYRIYEYHLIETNKM